MAIVASIVDIRGKAYEPVITEILFENDTVASNLVAFETDVKAETIFTENVNTAVIKNDLPWKLRGVPINTNR